MIYWTGSFASGVNLEVIAVAEVQRLFICRKAVWMQEKKTGFDSFFYFNYGEPVV